MKYGQGITYEQLINEVTQQNFKIDNPRRVYLVTGKKESRIRIW